MKKIILQQPEIKLIGITVRTNNKAEMDPATAKIGSTVAHYFQNGLGSTIPHRQKQNITFSLFTDYESDHTGDYTYFIGEAVGFFENCPEGFVMHTVPAQTYIKFTTEPGKMPEVVIQAWQQIWQMDEKTLGGKRAYRSDFEYYDERACDPKNTALDIFIGIIQ